LSTSFLGLNSSFDSGALITQLINLETQSKITPLETKKTNLNTENTFLGNLSTQVGTLKTAINHKNIITGDATLSPKLITSTDSSNSFLKVTTTDDAVSQTFNVSVDQLATTTIRKSSAAIRNNLTTASAVTSANFKGGITLSNGTVTINGETRTYTQDADPTIGEIETFLQGFSGLSAASYNATTGKFDLTFAVASLSNQFGSPGDASNLIAALGLDNVQINGVDTSYSGIQNLEAAKKTSTLTSLGVTGTTITINGTAVTYAPATDTIKTLVDSINNTAAAKVNAAYDAINGEIILTNKSTGALSITVSSNGDISPLNITGASAETLGENAEFTISTLNGGSTLVSNSNTVTGLLEGVTIELKKVTSAETPANKTITIAEDSSGVKTKMDSILTNVNRIITTLTNRNDSFSRNFITRIKNVMTKVEDAATDPYTSLIDIGLKSQLDGNNKFTGYSFDSTKFSEKFADNPDAFYTILYGSDDTESIYDTLSDGSDGIISQLQDLLDSYVDPNVSTNGLISQVQESIASQIKTVNDRIDRTQSSIDSYEARLRKQFSQLDISNTQLQQQQSAVSSLAAKLGQT
jgi:flagellar hook-associated protein 2